MKKTAATMALSLIAVTVQAAPAENLERLLGNISTLTGSFDQLVLDAGGTRLQQSSGRLWLNRPGQFRWETAEPFPQLLVADGVTLWLYDQDLEQVTQQPLDNRLDHTPALLLSGDLEKLSAAFEINGPESGDTVIYRLKPLDTNAMFGLLRIRFADGIPEEVQLEDNLGQRTSVMFHELQLNGAVDGELFRFSVPDGADLIVQ